MKKNEFSRVLRFGMVWLLEHSYSINSLIQDFPKCHYDVISFLYGAYFKQLIPLRVFRVMTIKDGKYTMTVRKDSIFGRVTIQFKYNPNMLNFDEQPKTD